MGFSSQAGMIRVEAILTSCHAARLQLDNTFGRILSEK